MGLCDTFRICLSILLISLNVLGFAVGAVLMSLGAAGFASYARNPSLQELIYGANVYEVLIFFITSGAALILLSILGILAGVFSLVSRLRSFAAVLLLFYAAIIFALYTFEVVAVTLDFSQFFAGKENVNGTVQAAFDGLLASDPGLNSSSAQFFFAWQTSNQCCGWLDGSAYGWSLYATNLINSSWRPDSCCGALNTTAWEVCYPWTPTYYMEGCDASFLASYSVYSWTYIGISIAAAVIEGLVLVISFFLIGLVHCSGPKGEKE